MRVEAATITINTTIIKMMLTMITTAIATLKILQVLVGQWLGQEYQLAYRGMYEEVGLRCD